MSNDKTQYSFQAIYQALKDENGNEIIKKPIFRPLKVANCIAVGGMIAFGKSTLVQALSNKYPGAKVVYELEENDQLPTLLLSKMYDRSNDMLFGSLFQLYFVLNRFDNYKNNCNQEKLTIFDRSIFEDWLFAHENITRPEIFDYYASMWKTICKELIYDYGVPKLYVILTGTWDLFKKRIYERNRQCEVENFAKNETYFKRLLDLYPIYMVDTCRQYGIPYVIVDANKELEEKVAIVEKELEKINVMLESIKQ